MTAVAKVAVENTAYHFDKDFDYKVPPALAATLRPGCRVLLPFGASNAKRQGMVLAIEEQESPGELKSLLAALDEAPLLSNEALGLVRWLQERCFCTYYDAVKLLLPAGMNFKVKSFYTLAVPPKELPQDAGEGERALFALLLHAKGPVLREKLLKGLGLATESTLPEKLCRQGLLQKISDTVRRVGDASQKMVCLADRVPTPKLTPKQKAVVDAVDDLGSCSVKELCYFTGTTPAVVNALAAKGVVRFYECERLRSPYQNVAEAAPRELVLSAAQDEAFRALLARYRSGRASTELLYGVTGSGKTAVFMRLIDEVLLDGRTVIVMVPEIALTPQTIMLFHKRYGGSVAVFHSGLSTAERLDEWKRVRSGDAQIVVGTRSAVFAPFENLGLVIMDEEQEYTYKSESSPRYHARDVAKFRCAHNNALLLLCSATPSLESYYAALSGRYGLHRLPARYGAATLPTVETVDMNGELAAGNDKVLSGRLYDALCENLKNGKQSILLMNRRGYNTFVSCKACGTVATCPSCSISLTYHSANGRLMCHYCGYSTPMTDLCPGCGERRMHCAGAGTQRAEEQLIAALPQARILRLDTDATMTRFSYGKKLHQFSEGAYDIIVGTQMVAKGLDFENVTLVGVLSADQALYSDDFRSYEHAFSLLTQVVGRSGRGQYEGRAIIQTFTPESEIIALAARQDYEKFYEGEIALRKAMLYPPFVDICVVGFVGLNEQQTAKASRGFLSRLSLLAQHEYADEPMRVLRPTAAAVAKVSNKYRYKLIVKCRNSKRFREMMSRLLTEFAAERLFAGVSAFADINPDSIL